MKSVDDYYDMTRAQEGGGDAEDSEAILTTDQVMQSLYSFREIHDVRFEGPLVAHSGFGESVRPSRSAALFRRGGTGSFRFGRMLARIDLAAESSVSEEFLDNKRALVIRIECDKTVFPSRGEE
jgi:hypothetical protein